MPVDNATIADLFDRLADLLEIESANPFRVRAYRNASRTIRGYPRSMVDLVEENADLSQLPDIGKDLEKKIRTIVRTGKLPLLAQVQSRTPGMLSDLMKIEGLGPKRVKTLYEALQVRSVDDLNNAVRAGKVRALPGFGAKTERMLEERLRHFSGQEQRTQLAQTELIAEPLVEHLKRTKGVKQVTVAGSFRRRKDTVGDLDILVTAAKSSLVMDRFVAYDHAAEVISKGNTRSTVRLGSGMQVDLRVVPQVSYGAALHYFTGSKAHNIAVRKIGVRKGYKINEYGVFKGKKRIAGRTENEVFASVGLVYVEPELREGRGEIEAARKDKLPALVAVEDVRGDLHCHANATDGGRAIRRMVNAAAERGYEYLAVSYSFDHAGSARRLSEKRLLEQFKAIDRLNEKLDRFTVLKAAHLEILEDGSLSLPDKALRAFDLTICGAHSQFDLSASKQTERILRAMDNRHFSILEHPTGRLTDDRDAYEVDLDRLLQGASERGRCVELNAQPNRLDLTDEVCRLAKSIGVKVAVTTEAHNALELDLLRFGIDQARRGWLESGDVLNTRSLLELRPWLARP